MFHTTAPVISDHDCNVIQITAVYLPERIVEMGRENNTIISMQLIAELHIYRLWTCGFIEVSINHGEWTEYLPFPPKGENAKPENN